MITLRRNQILVTDWVITDPDIVAFLADVEPDDDELLQLEYEALLLRALKIGVVALERAETQVNLDVIRREFDAWQIQVQDCMDSVFREDQGKLAVALGHYLGDGGKLDDLFDPAQKDSAIGRIQSILDEHFGGDGAKFSRLLDCTEAGSPLAKLRDVWDRDLNRITIQLSALELRLAEKEATLKEREKSPRKGFDFEEDLQLMLNRLAKPFGDSVTDVSTTATLGRSKKGDFLVQVNNSDTGGQDAFIVIEAKRRGKAVTGRTGILQEMEDAMASRKAQFAIAVFTDDVCPGEVGQLRAYPNNRILCSIDPSDGDSLPLEVAYKLARTELCWQLRRGDTGIDRAKVTEVVKYAQEKLAQFSGLKKNATSLVNTATNLRVQLDDIERSIGSALKDILVELEPESLSE